MWRAHVSSRRTVTEMYNVLVKKGALKDDPGQRAMAQACTPLLNYINSPVNGELVTKGHAPFLSSAARSVTDAVKRLHLNVRRYAFPNRKTRDVSINWPENVGVDKKTGIYMWGSVGIGKTLIMDLFELCDTPGFTKRRSHLHSFMSDIVWRLHVAEEVARVTNASPLDLVVNDVLQESPILCLDEFQTFDVTHAALLSGFFSRALPQGLIVFTTSNRPPQELTSISTAFERFLPILWQYCDVIHCDSTKDYRESASSSHHGTLFLSPNTEENATRLLQLVERGFMGDSTWIRDTTIWLYGRELLVPFRRGSVALFDFSDICGPLGPPDFQCIAKSFHIVIITNVPQISLVSKNAAQQFIILVDELYQYNVKLLFTSEVPWDRLVSESASNVTFSNDLFYSEGEDERSGYSAHYNFRNTEELLSFDRIASRLKEMGCQHYLLRDHNHFLVSDYNLAALLE
ncbi:ATPase [Trypanosoma theileri]|uniref:ATPase n=1 Tax=Trypanosoma theileri TaxID=67003 RepID=A0A1X0NN10_9TRYP|nr:ATPase [Trypanosoma theileri]ORC85519.1 ATPase [Trypanosoma theileri]